MLFLFLPLFSCCVPKAPRSSGRLSRRTSLRSSRMLSRSFVAHCRQSTRRGRGRLTFTGKWERDTPGPLREALRSQADVAMTSDRSRGAASSLEAVGAVTRTQLGKLLHLTDAILGTRTLRRVEAVLADLLACRASVDVQMAGCRIAVPRASPHRSSAGPMRSWETRARWKRSRQCATR